jgi:hypothetical protein
MAFTKTQLVIQKGVTSTTVKWYDWNIIDDASEDNLAGCREIITRYTKDNPYLNLKIIQRTTIIEEVDIL